jgi:hypothetical protein
MVSTLHKLKPNSQNTENIPSWRISIFCAQVSAEVQTIRHVFIAQRNHTGFTALQLIESG